MLNILKLIPSYDRGKADRKGAIEFIQGHFVSRYVCVSLNAKYKANQKQHLCKDHTNILDLIISNGFVLFYLV